MPRDNASHPPAFEFDVEGAGFDVGVLTPRRPCLTDEDLAPDGPPPHAALTDG
jgi:hypothetical protein